MVQVWTVTELNKSSFLYNAVIFGWKSIFYCSHNILLCEPKDLTIDLTKVVNKMMNIADTFPGIRKQ